MKCEEQWRLRKGGHFSAEHWGGGESPEILDGGMEASGRKWANDEDGVRREKGEVKS